jgi:transcriptional regulator with XRE-family HTH domain
VDLADLVSLIRERREALGSSQSELARFSGLSRRMLASLETGVPSDVGVSRVPSLLSVLGLDLHLDPPSQAVRTRKRGLWMAAKNASVSYVQGVPPATLGHTLRHGAQDS